MIKCEVIESDNEANFQIKLNLFIQKHIYGKNNKFIDVKFSSTWNIKYNYFVYSALVIYEENNDNT